MRAPVTAGGARLGAGILDALNHQVRRTVVRVDGDLVGVVAVDEDDPTAPSPGRPEIDNRVGR